MKRNLLEKHNKFLAFLLSVIGVGGACTFGGCAYGTPMEYGTPTATFKVHGKVLADENTGIGGIQVGLLKQTTLSKSDGTYEIGINDFPTDQKYVLEFDDIDGAANGEFAPLDTTISFVDPEFKNPDGHWYKGETSKEVNVVLKPKN